MESETRYELEQPFPYGNKAGDNVEAEFLVIQEPHQHHLGEIGKIRKWVSDALRANRDEIQEVASDALEEAEAKRAEAEAEADGEEDEESESIAPGVMIGILTRADIPLEKLYLSVMKILESPGVVKLDGHTKMTPPLWKKVSGHDAEMIIGTYISVFFLR